jgi:hypothetical protein
MAERVLRIASKQCSSAAESPASLCSTICAKRQHFVDLYHRMCIAMHACQIEINPELLCVQAY